MSLYQSNAVLEPYHAKILAENAKLRAALEEVESYFEDRADVVDDGRNGRQSPNTEMSILSEIRQALGKAR